MYSEHIVATLLDLVQRSYYYGYELDRDLTRTTVQIGKILGPDLGAQPSDQSLAWHAQKFGTPAPIGTRAAVHVLTDGRIGIGLGSGRGIIETTGGELALLTNPEPGRYSGAWRHPTIEYGGLL